MKTPTVSVILSVYNGENYISTAIDSILKQTFRNFELIILDDASADGTVDILHSYDDPRIRLLENEVNLGVTRSLNRGLAAAQGQYIARLDADDIAAPQRLEVQVGFLDRYSQVGLVGSWHYRAVGDRVELVQKPVENAEIQQQMLYKGIFAHSTVMFRRECIEKVGVYDPDFALAQDEDLWLRIAEHWEVAIIPIPLVTIRLVPTGLGRVHQSRQAQFILKARTAALARRTHSQPLVAPTKETIARHYLYRSYEAFSENQTEASGQYIEEAFRQWPPLEKEADRIITALVYRAYDRWLGGMSQTNFWPTAKAESGKLVAMLRRLSGPARQLRSKCRKARAEFYIVIAFGSKQKEELDVIPKSCAIALFNNPRWLGNRGVISIFLEAALGRAVVSRVRSVVGKS